MASVASGRTVPATSRPSDVKDTAPRTSSGNAQQNARGGRVPAQQEGDDGDDHHLEHQHGQYGQHLSGNQARLAQGVVERKRSTP